MSHTLALRHPAAMLAIAALFIAALIIGIEAAHGIVYAWQHPMLYGPEQL